MNNTMALRLFTSHMTARKLSPVTSRDRLEVVARFASFLGEEPLLEASPEQINAFQSTYAHLSIATVNIYSRHLKAFYDWAVFDEYLDANPARRMIIPKTTRGIPHPTRVDDLRLIFACARGPLRTAFALAAFAGLRRGEISRLRYEDIDVSSPTPTALVQGKGGKERLVPLLWPVVGEFPVPTPRRGVVVTKNGRPYPVESLSIDSHYFFRALGVETTLHSMRHFFATSAARITRDPLLVRDLLGHASVATTEIYMQTSLVGAHDRLADLGRDAEYLLLNQIDIDEVVARQR